MYHYSIADLEQMSGIKAHTIRIWEQRYNALKPKRTAGNTRYYDDSQVKKLLNIVSLSEAGIKISDLFALSEREIGNLLQKQIEYTKSQNVHAEYFISQMLISGLAYNEMAFDKHFSACLVRFGMKGTYVNVIYPMMVRIGLMWGKDDLCPAQEHFISNLIRQKLLTAIDGLPQPSDEKKCWLLFLPQEEDHDLGLLFANYLIRSAGKKTIYLGSRVPSESLNDAMHDIAPTHVLFFISHQRTINVASEYLKGVKKIFKNSKLHIAGNEKLIKQLRPEKNFSWISSVEELEGMIDSN